MAGPEPRLLIVAPPAPRPISRAWLVIFADLVSLLLAFFVLLFSMSTVETEKWKAVTEALSERLKSNIKVVESRPAEDLDAIGVDAEDGLDLGYLGTVLQTQARANPALEDSLVFALGDRLVVSLPTDLLFRPGHADLTADARQGLFELGGLLRNVANDVVVFGHTSPTPMRGPRFSSNWELSLARAVTVTGELRRAGYTRDIVVFGAADSRFGEISARLPWVRRMELARRVDIIITTTKRGS